MSILIRFYRDAHTANNKPGHYFSDILDWSDERLETSRDYFLWLFPVPSILTPTDISLFQTDRQLRKNILRAVKRMLLFYGYIAVRDDVKSVKPLKRFENGVLVGLYSSQNYRRLTQMKRFLTLVDLEIAWQYVLLSVCHAMHSSPALYRKIQDSDEFIQWIDTCPITGLTYTGNSCYQDSILLALLALPNRFIDRNILYVDTSSIKSETVCDERVREEIRDELVRITDAIRGEKRGETCSRLRTLLERCKHSSEAFHSTGQQDAGEFLLYLFSIFGVNGLFVRRQTFVSNSLAELPEDLVKVTDVSFETSPVVVVSSDVLEGKQQVSLADFLQQQEDSVFDEKNLFRGPNNVTYRRRQELYGVVKGEFLVFYVQRLFLGRRVYTEVVCPERVFGLELYAIVVHERAHYTCYIKCSKKWFYYNDLSDEIKGIGTYNDMFAQRDAAEDVASAREPPKYPDVKTTGVLYFYRSYQ